MIIYMPLLNEGTMVYRPVSAVFLGEQNYKVLTTPEGKMPEELDEEWEFPVGSIVKCKYHKGVDSFFLVPYQVVQDYKED